MHVYKKINIVGIENNKNANFDNKHKFEITSCITEAIAIG